MKFLVRFWMVCVSLGLLFGWSATLLLAQSTATFEVFVKDELERNGLAGVRIELFPLNRTQFTNSQGRAVFTNIDYGKYKLECTLDGYGVSSKEEVVGSNFHSLTVFIIPHELVFEDMITVTPKDYDVGQRDLSSVIISNVPGAGEDPFKVLQTTPGIIAPSDADAGLYIRGSPPSENLILLDGVPIYDPYRLYGLITLFYPETVSYFSIWPGGFPARYGNRLSAVVEVYNRYGTTEKYLSGSFNLSFTNSSLLAEGKLPLQQGAGSWMVTMRRTYYDLILNAIEDEPTQFPYFFDVQARFFYQPTAEHEFSFFSIFSEEGTDFSNEFETEFSSVELDLVDDQNSRIFGLNHHYNITPKVMLTTILSSYTNQQTADFQIIIGEEAFVTELSADLTSDEYMLQERLELAFSDNHLLETGFSVAQNRAEYELSFQSEDPAITIPPELLNFVTRSENQKLSFYVQDQWTIQENLILGTGIRYDYGSISDMNRWSPRLDFSYSLNSAHRFKLAWGIYYHFPSYEALQGDGLLFDLEDIDELHLKPEQAHHYTLGYELRSVNDFRFTFDLYYKELENLIVGQKDTYTVLEYHEDGTTSYRTIEDSGIMPYNGEQGYAQGVEMVLDKEHFLSDAFNLQLAYSLAETRAHRDNEGWYYRGYDQRHTLNLKAQYAFSKRWQLSFIWRYGSGFPYTPIGEVITIVEDANGNGEYNPKEGERLSYFIVENSDLRNSRRLPAYHRLDARLNYILERPSYSLTFYIDVINLYDRDNVQGFEYNDDYSERAETTGLPFVPSFGIRITF